MKPKHDVAAQDEIQELSFEELTSVPRATAVHATMRRKERTIARTFERRCLLAFAALALVVGVGAPVARAENTVVYNRELMELHVIGPVNAEVLGLYLVDEDWQPISGGVVDGISAKSPIQKVSVGFQSTSSPSWVRIRPDNSSIWGPWRSLTEGRIGYELPVPAAGESSSWDYQVLMQLNGSTLIDTVGQIRILRFSH